ncbi:MAG: zinc metalloprotease HtpX [Cytophagales bacterium]|nr:zinc metalloprotease HtpX [Cytophagales bacterium]
MSRSEVRFQNSIQKYFLLIGAFVLAAFIGSLWLGWTLSLLLLGVGAMITSISLNMSPERILRWQKARKLDRYYQVKLYQLVNALARRAGLQYSPDIYLVPNQVPNAFALGSKERPVIGITSGLVNVLNERELSGVLAHEISHIKNNDLLIKGLASSFGNLTNTLSWIGRILLLFTIPMMLLGIETLSLGAILLLVFSPALNILLQLGLSRSMEYLADHDAAMITQDPMGLASALHQIENLSTSWWTRFWKPAVTHSSDEWLRSHPDTQKRISKLRSLAGKSNQKHVSQPRIHRNYYWGNGNYLMQ